MKRIALYLGIAAALVASCSIQEEIFETPQQEDVIYYATFEQPADEGTRVYANEDLLLRWTADDRVSIFGKNTYNQQYKFLGETGDNSGGFSKVDGAEYVTGNPITHTVSVYPYQEGTRISESETITLTLPAEQHYAENTFGLGANTMVSVSSDNYLQYKNVGGYLRLSLYGEGVSVSSITMKGNNGEKLSGKASVSMPVNSIPTIEMASDAGEEITLVCDTPIKIGSTAETAITFWIVVPPTVFSKGVTITVKDNKNDVFEKTTSSRIEINRSKLVKMSPLKTEIPGSTSDPDDYSSQYLTFEILSDGSISWVSEFNAYTMPKTIEYSLNNGPWNEITSTMEGVSISVNKGDIIRFRGDNESYGVLKVINSQNRPWYNYFRSTCQFKVYGNIMSLINSAKFKNLTSLTESCAFFSLFKGCVNLVDASHLVLPAITLTERCYWNMFMNCSNLVSAPELPAEVLADHCYTNMFYGCSRLEYIKCLATDISASSSTSNWVYNVSSSGVFVRAISMDSWSTGISGIPKGWTVETNNAENYEAVDLGLSVKWANMNLGASKPEEYGDYYAWGEIEPKQDSSWETYKWCMGSFYTLTKYCSISSWGYNGFTDTKTVLDPEDDAANVNLGGTWRMPTKTDFEELCNNCTWEWIAMNGSNGRKVTGPNGNSIFLPAAGYRDGTRLCDVDSAGRYWSSSLDVTPYYAWYMDFFSSDVFRGASARFGSRSIRPVCD